MKYSREINRHRVLAEILVENRKKRADKNTNVNTHRGTKAPAPFWEPGPFFLLPQNHAFYLRRIMLLTFKGPFFLLPQVVGKVILDDLGPGKPVMATLYQVDAVAAIVGDAKLIKLIRKALQGAVRIGLIAVV